MNKLAHIILAGIVLGFFSCKKQDGIYEEFLVPNGLVYPGQARNVVAKSGNERIEIEWQRGADPKVVKTRIFWNNYTDSVEVAINKSMDIISRIIPLPENSYSFMLHTYDIDGNISVPVETLGTVYGEAYLRSLNNRLIRSKSYSESTQTLTLEWNEAAKTETGVNLIHGDNVPIVIDRTETLTVIPDFDIDKSLFYNTMYKPDSLAIDTFYAPTVEIILK